MVVCACSARMAACSGGLAVEALAEFAQARQAWAFVQRFDVVDEFGDAG